MEKTIYIARCDRYGKGRDRSLCLEGSFDLTVTFDLATARKAVENDLRHLTAKEREANANHIDGYTVEILDGETAEEAYSRLLDDDEMPGNPDFYENYAKA